MASGGAWMIGYKGWSGFMGMCMAQLGVIVVSPDYRNYPQGTISDMEQDISTAIQWTFDNIEKYGGDITRIFLCGQSAGSHISTLTLLNRAKIRHKIKNNYNNNNNQNKKTNSGSYQRHYCHGPGCQFQGCGYSKKT